MTGGTRKQATRELECTWAPSASPAHMPVRVRPSRPTSAEPPITPAEVLSAVAIVAAIAAAGWWWSVGVPTVYRAVGSGECLAVQPSGSCAELPAIHDTVWASPDWRPAEKWGGGKLTPRRRLDLDDTDPVRLAALIEHLEEAAADHGLDACHRAGDGDVERATFLAGAAGAYAADARLLRSMRDALDIPVYEEE